MGLAFIPLVALGLYALMLVLPWFDPGRRNYASFAKPYALLRTAIVLFLGVLYAGTLVAAHGRTINMMAFIMPALGVMFLVMGNVMGKIRPNWFVGIRTPWTLSSKQSWNKTHRLGGRLFMALGLMFIAAAFAPPELMLPLINGAPLALVCVLLPY
jgi:uncharacterized membrane protein